MKYAWFILMAILSMVGLFIYQSNIEVGSWLMGAAAGIGICIAHPIYKDLLELQLAQIRDIHGK